MYNIKLTKLDSNKYFQAEISLIHHVGNKNYISCYKQLQTLNKTARGNKSISLFTI